MSLPARCAAIVTVALAACASRPLTDAAPTNRPAADTASASTITLTDATRIAIEDTWDGLGCTYVFSVALTVSADGWRGAASLRARPGGPSISREVTMPLAAIARLEQAVTEARAAMARAPSVPLRDRVRSRWTDDYPSGSMHFTRPATDYALAFTNQHRQLELAIGDVVEPLDVPQDELERPSDLWTAYSDALTALGLHRWLDEACAAR